MRLLRTCAWLMLTSMSFSFPDADAAVPTTEPAGDVTVLWPDGAPGGDAVEVREVFSERAPGGTLRDRIVQHVTRPALTRFRPAGEASGVTLLFVPGGAYERVVIDKEGFESAEWFAQRGFDCAVLRYRLPADGWKAGVDAPVHDVVRALRLLRAEASQNPSAATRRIGVVGFSAGGHAVARAITDAAAPLPAQDDVDRLPWRPDFAVLMYPVIASTGSAAHGGTMQQLRAAGISAGELERLAPHLKVPARTPPTLLIHAADDQAVPPENSLLMFSALQAAGVRSELHIFDRGGHGFGMRGVAGKNVAAWPELVAAWALGADKPTPAK